MDKFLQQRFWLKTSKANLIIVESLCKYKPDISAIMKSSKFKEVNSSEFVFNNNLKMVSYFPKKSKSCYLS